MTKVFKTLTTGTTSFGCDTRTRQMAIYLILKRCAESSIKMSISLETNQATYQLKNKPLVYRPTD